MTGRMRHGALGGALALGLAVAAACGDDPAGSSRPDGLDGSAIDAPDAPVVDALAASPFGLDTRPVNTSCRAPARPPAAGLGARWERVFAGLPLGAQNVVELVKRPNAGFYVLEQRGRVLSFAAVPSVTTVDVALDLLARVTIGFEGGLLGFVLHPKFAQNGSAYAYYTRREGPTGGFFARVARFTSTDAGATFDPASEHVILDFPIGVTGTGHTGGRLVFGLDGLLYLSTGDASLGDESQRTSDIACDAPSPCSLHGKLLRLDVDGADPYAIPPSNPFAAGGGKKEIFAWGFRNPFRFSVDRATGALWVGDVGNATWEEIDRVEAGGNYGWPRAEGPLCLDPLGCQGLREPVFAAPTTSAPSCVNDPTPCMQAIVGGYVYRGTAIPELHGAYVYGDFGTGKQRALVPDAMTGALRAVDLAPDGPSFNVVSFAEDEGGELFALDFNGPIFALVRDGAEPSAGLPFPAKLSQTGCVDPADPTRPAAGVVPYVLNAPFFSDSAEKERAFAIPDGTTIGVAPDGDLDLPIGSVTMKTFRVAGRRVETRLFVRHADGEWAGYSYEWNDAGTDATLLPGSKVKKLTGQEWAFPARSECRECHTSAAGRTLGLELAQLDRKADYPGRPQRDQVATLAHVGYLGAAPTLPTIAPLPAPDGFGEPSARARAVLHASCSGCHRPTGPTASTMDLRFSTPLALTRTCDVAPSRGDLGLTGARLLAPRAPGKSVLLERMRRHDAWRMPPLVNRRVDEAGAALVEGLVNATAVCP